MDETQVIRIHGPYEDAIIAGCEVAKAVIDGQTPEVRAQLWQRWIEVTEPLHKLAVAAGQDLAKLIEALKK